MRYFFFKLLFCTIWVQYILGGSLKIAIVTLSTQKIPPYYLAQSIVNKALYARKHNYTLLVYPNLDFDRPDPWSKILAIQQTIQLDNYDWIFWMDGDTIITNTSVSIESFMTDKFFILSRDCQNLNTGVILIKSTPIVSEFLSQIYRGKHVTNETIHHMWWEQRSWIDLYDSNATFREYSTIYSQKKLNSHYSDSKCGRLDRRAIWSPGDFLIHFPGFSSNKRNSVFNEFLNYVI